jgi:hypothetical protein
VLIISDFSPVVSKVINVDGQINGYKLMESTLAHVFLRFSLDCHVVLRCSEALLFVQLDVL